MRNLKKQQGVAIVLALFIVALATTLAYIMISRLEKDTRRTSLILRNVKAEFYAQGSIAWAMTRLRNNLAHQKPNYPVDKIPMLSPVDHVYGYSISSTIDDMQARFNVNNLVNPDAQTDFKRLLQLADAKISALQAEEITLAITHWITPGQQSNEYDSYYLTLSPPYRAAHRPMVSASELQLVKGITPALFNALQPYVTALPTATLINSRTAPGLVLAALTPDMTIEAGRAIEKMRTKMPAVSAQAFLNLDIVKNHNIPSDKMTEVSNYFMIVTRVFIEYQNSVLYTLVERTGNESNNSVSIIWQSKGTPG